MDKTHKTLPRSAQLFPSTIAAEAIFGSSARIYGPIANEIASVVITVAYTFMDASEFKEKGASDKPGQVNQIYWREILNRAHMASAVSLVRTGRWVEAVVREHDEANLMGWTACCRSLLEAIGDTVDALQYVSLTLAENHRSIESSLEGSMTRDYLISPELEDILIHFSHARRIAKSDATAPASHRTKQTAEYITILERMRIPEVKLLYSELRIHAPGGKFRLMHVRADRRRVG